MRPEQLLLFLNRQRLGVPAPQAGAAPPDPQLETLQADIADFERAEIFREFRRLRGREDVDIGLQQAPMQLANAVPFAAPLPAQPAAPAPAPVPPVSPEVAALVAQYGPAQLAAALLAQYGPPVQPPKPPEGDE